MEKEKIQCEISIFIKKNNQRFLTSEEKRDKNKQNKLNAGSVTSTFLCKLSVQIFFFLIFTLTYRRTTLLIIFFYISYNFYSVHILKSFDSNKS